MNHPIPFISKTKEGIPADAQVIENLDASLEELFFIEHPQYKKRTPDINGQVDTFIKNHAADDCWVYYPWRKIAIHTVSEALYFRLRTARNRNVITEEQQKKYRDLVIGVAGLSVGSAVLAAVTTSGGSKTMKIADFDVLELTNLNRIRAALPDIGSNKTHVAAREIWELDPFADLILFDEGISRDTIEDFILGSPRLDVFIDEMDSIDLKIIARGICKQNKIPVLMATDNGDGIILDVERFDEEPERPLFHGLIPDMDPKELGTLSFPQWLQLATKIVGPEYLTESMQDSLLAIGKTIPSVPQLGASAALAGSAMSFVLRKIAAGETMASGRYTMGFEEKLIPNYLNSEEVEKRKKKTESFLANFSKNK
jgi:molybdopterin/thiamine biosynthesis adenylyltransferase